MAADEQYGAPFFCRWIIRAAGPLVPPDDRREWLNRQLSDAGQLVLLLAEQGITGLKAQRQLVGFSFECLADAWHRRLVYSDPFSGFKRRLRSPSAFFFIFFLALLGCAAATGWFAAIRRLQAPLPYVDPDRLVSCYQVHFLSFSFGTQSRYIKPWQTRSNTLTGIEAYQVRTAIVQPAGLGQHETGLASVTPGFFTLLGVSAHSGRLFNSDDPPGSPLAVVSYDFWRRRLAGAEYVIGLPMAVEDRTVEIVGVLPEGFWFRSPKIQVWALLPDLTRPAPETRLVYAVGRLRPPHTPEEARQELQRIAFSTSRFRGGAFRAVPLEQALRPGLQIVFLVFFACSSMAVFFAGVQLVRAWRRGRGSRSEALRYWAFFSAKTLLLLGGSALLAVELYCRVALAISPSKFVLGMLIDWGSVLAAMFILRWTSLDQSRRCPVCLRRLAISATSGSWGSALLEPFSTELLCDQGHGALRFSEMHATLGEIRRWVAMDDSWKELMASS